MSLVIDFSHVHRPTTGIERVSLELFASQNLPGVDTIHIRAKSNSGMVRAQWATMPARAIMRRNDVFLCPGFPPSILLMLAAGKRVAPYIHDMFLLERKRDLNRTAKYYMRPSFRFAVHRGRHFFVNSLYTRQELRRHCRADAAIDLLRPQVNDVFGLVAYTAIPAQTETDVLRLLAIGTLEPRKNFRYAVQIRNEIEALLGRKTELHIVGRKGWGDEAEWYRRQKDVVLHGYLEDSVLRDTIGRTDIFLSTSFEEGLGLPLLEVQHGGKCVVASDIPAYREVLGSSGCLIPLGAAREAAGKIAALIAEPQWKERHQVSALANVAAWNRQAAADKAAFMEWALLHARTQG